MILSRCVNVQEYFWLCLSSFQADGQNTDTSLGAGLNTLRPFCCRDSSLASSGFKCSVSAVQLTALTSDSVNRDNRCSLIDGLRGEVWKTHRLTRQHDGEARYKNRRASACGEIAGSNPVEARQSENSDGVAAPSTDYGLKLPVGHEGLSRVGDNKLGSKSTSHTRTGLERAGKAIAFTKSTSN